MCQNIIPAFSPRVSAELLLLLVGTAENSGGKGWQLHCTARGTSPMD